MMQRVTKVTQCNVTPVNTVCFIIASWLLSTLAYSNATATTQAQQRRHVYALVEFSVKNNRVRRDWSGRVRISEGRIVEIKKWHRGPADTVRPDGSWNIVFGRRVKENETASRPLPRKGIVLAVSAPDTAVLHFETAVGNFDVRLSELNRGSVTRLSGMFASAHQFNRHHIGSAERVEGDVVGGRSYHLRGCKGHCNQCAYHLLTGNVISQQ